MEIIRPGKTMTKLKRFHLKLQYYLGKRPEDFRVGQGKELVEFCAVNQIDCCLIQGHGGIYVYNIFIEWRDER